MNTKILLLLIILGLFTGIAASPIFAASLTVGSANGNVSEQLVVPITVDNPELLAGAAFTLQYDPALNVSLDSIFFDTFFNQFDVLPTTDQAVPDGNGWKFPLLDQSGNPVLDDLGNPVFLPAQATVGDQAYTQPLIDNAVTAGAVINHHIAAARCMPATAGEDPTLFTLYVSLDAGAPAGTYSINIVPTTLNNVEAGYDPNGETIDLLVGSDLTQTVESGLAFPVLLDDATYAANVTSGNMVFSDPPVDTDQDGLPDDWEIDNFGGLSHDGTLDSDGDGYTDYWESQNGTDPNDGVTSAGLTGYSGCTDTRVANSLQMVNLTSSSAAIPGNAFTVDVNYDTSDGLTSTGIDLFVFFDSSKVTYTGYGTFLTGGAEMTSAPEVENVIDDVNDDDKDAATDKKIRMAWLSLSGGWPSVSLPVKLAELQFTVNGTTSDGEEIRINVLEESHDVTYAICTQGLSVNATNWLCDVDNNGLVDAFSDGILIVRYLLGFQAAGSTWVDGAVAPNASRSDAASIESYISGGIDNLILDIDGNGVVDAFSDGILIVRYLLGFQAAGATWIDGAVAPNATRMNAENIESYLGQITSIQ